MTASTELLQRAVDEVARLLDADGAIVYLIDPATDELYFAHDAGITDPEAQHLIRDMRLPVGVGMFGTAVARREMILTDDYRSDARFEHSPLADRIVEYAGICSMAVAPMLANDEAMGALGAYSSRASAFSEAQVTLLRALADHAAGAIGNERLLARVSSQAAELARRVETQQTLQRIAAQITALRDSDAVLQVVVDAAARLLDSDGAHLTLLDPREPILRPHVMAGKLDAEASAWLGTQEFPVGGGMNGLAAELGQAVWTNDYLVEPRIPHTQDDQQVADKMGLRGMAVAPLRAPEGAVIGTLAISHRTPRDTSPDEIELLQGLADVGAIAITNARLYDRIGESERRYRFLVDNSPDLVWAADRDGNFTYLSETLEPLLGYHSDELVGSHFSTVIAPESLPIVAEHWARAVAEPQRRQQYRLVVLDRDGGRVPMEINAVGTEVDGAFTGAHGSVRDIRERVLLEEDLRRQADELERALEVQRVLGEISRRIVEIADSGEVLQQVVDAAKQLAASDGAHLTLMNDERTDLIPMVLAGDTQPETRAWLHAQRFPVGGGINGLAAAEGMAVWTDDYARDPRIPHDPGDDSPARLELGAVAVAPLRSSGGEVVGTLAITYREPRVIERRDVTLLEELASQGAIAARNTRLYADLRNRSEDLARLVEAQRTLAAIAAQISAIRDPAGVLRRTVDEARRLLGADHAIINQYQADVAMLADLDATDLEPMVDAVPIPFGKGIAGAAIQDETVRRTGDYVNDDTFEHVPEADAWMAERGFHSQMSAPLLGEAGPIGALTVYAARQDAFSDTDAELLGALASHAAIVQANARLYGEARAAAEQMEISERRYRHLVDHSPDLVWSVDAEGQFTYLGESLERMTGHRPDQLLGRHWSALTLPDSVHIATAGWEAIRAHPDDEQQIRISLPMASGGTIPAEVNMIGTTVDGHFAGAHGSIRDIRERERLEEDLRRRSAELAANQERANLARELHDSVTQALFSMGLTLRALELLFDRDPEAARAKLTELRDLQKDALAEMRTLIFELRPRGLETDGLAQALRTHAAAVEGRTGLAVTVEVDSDERLPLETEEALYRIAQEALHNVVKHASARTSRIELRRSGRELRLTIDDDGIGFDPTTTPRGHLGVVGMRQRAERLDGSLVISRRPAGGTRVRVSLPLAQSAE